jgi:hypothetical protein
MFTPEITGSNTGSVKLTKSDWELQLPALTPRHVPHIIALHALKYICAWGKKKGQQIAKDTTFSSSCAFLSSNVHIMVKLNDLIGVPNKNV